MPPHLLKLKVNAVIVLMVNLDVAAGHCNRTRYIVQSIGNNFIVDRKLIGSEHDLILILKIPFISNDQDLGFTFTRLHFPVMLAYYMIFNRAQGQSVEKCRLHLPQKLFTNGQLYVELSRCGNPRKVFVWADQKECHNLG